MAAELPTFTPAGAEAYAGFAKFSGGYRASIQAMLELGIKPALRCLPQGESVKILEVGAGQGKSAWAIDTALRSQDNLPDIRIFRTEPDEKKTIAEGRAAFFSGSDTELLLPEVVAPAEVLPVAGEFVRLVVGSQVLHWMNGEQARRSFREAHRVLKDGGTLVHATSGIMNLLSYNEHHFTRHPFVLYQYLPLLEAALTRRGYWDRAKDGVFVPWNPQANPVYYRYTLADVRQWLQDAGFHHINIRMSMFPCDTKEIEARLSTNFAALEMHFFQSERLKAIPKEEKMEMAKTAFEAAKAQAPDLFASFDRQNREVTIGSVFARTSGEPVPVIVARK
ncbi:class I SAM-dependent methyltransferase [Candidatus Gottesmanbacteria bacterium]|nr:class I SAM-dependent methyltransferase [Candidatus Gottesmanbacteria bacterium]